MSQNNPRLQWMQQMVNNCFSKGDENAIHAPDKELIQKFLDFIQGKMGKTLLIYYQKPNSNGDKNSDSLQPVYLINEETKNVELQNRACFFIRSCADGKEATSDTDINFGELTSDSIIGMNKVIYNYIYQNIENVDNHEWGKIEPEQKKEFKKVLESFSKDMNDTVDSLVKGVKFQELPPEVRDYIQQDKKDYIRDEEKQQYISKIEEIYQNWIDVLSKEIEDMDKDNPAFSDSGPKSELERWKYRMQRLTKVNDFFKSADYRMVSKYFAEQKNKLSTKVQTLTNDMKQKKIDSHTAHAEARDNVKYLSTLEIYFDPLYNGTPDTIIDSLQSLMNSLKLISFTARYYDSTKMTNLFSKITSQMINNCINYILDIKKNPTNNDPAYLWEQKPEDLIEKFEKCIELYKQYKEKYKQAKTNTTSTNKENNFEFGENQLFGKFEQFCKRLKKLIELFTTIKQFEDIRAHKLDSMETIQVEYDEQLENFKHKTSQLLKYNDTKFDKDYVAFNLQINDIENELHKIINEEFKKLNWIEKKLKLLAKYEKILTKPNLQANLRTEKLEIFSNYKREIDLIQATFDSNRTSPQLQRNMPKISGRIKWAKHLFDRIFPFINSFKDIAAKDRKETELSYMTTNTLLYSYIILNEKFFEQFVESAKPKLTLPLLIINENQSPKVNLDLYVLQLIREAKCMMRMNCKIPEAAKIILLQEEKFKKYYNELAFMVKEYNRILSRINKSEAEYYFKGHIKDLNLKLTPLKSTINWSSMNIESSLQVVFECLQKFEYSIDSFMEILDNRVHRNMLTIKKLELLRIPDEPTKLTINDIITAQEEHVKNQNNFLKNKNTEIEQAILDMINGIKSYEVDPKITKVDEKTLYKLISDYEDKFYEFLIATTKNSLNSLKERISGDKSQPIFKVDVVLTNNTVEIRPKIQRIQEAINKIAKSILFAMKDINSWKRLDSEEISSFHERVGKDNEIVKMILILTGSYQSNNVEIEKYLKETFDPFKPIWIDNIEKKIKEFNQKPNKTYADYEEKLNEYGGIENRIKAIPDEKPIGAVAVNLIPIKDNLLKYVGEWKWHYMRQLLLTTKATSKDLNQLIGTFEEKLNINIENLEDLKQVVDAIEEIRENEGTIENKIKPFVLYYTLAKQHLKESDFERYSFPTKEDFDTKWKNILQKSGEIRDKLQKDQLQYKKRLYEDAAYLREQVNLLKADYDQNGPTKESKVEVAYDKLESYRRKVVNLNKLWKNIKNAERIFNVSKNFYPELENMEDELKKLGTLYDLYMNVIKQKEEWKEMKFNELNAKKEEMENKCQEFASKQFKVNKALTTTPEYENLKNDIAKLQSIVETFDLLTFDFEDHHWRDLAEKTGIKELATIKQDGGLFSLKILFDHDIDNFKGDIEDTVTIAKQQKKIDTQLKEIDEEWKTKVFKFEPHKTIKDLQLLDTVSTLEIKATVEEHSGKISGFKSQSRNLTPELNARIKQKETAFQTINNTLELWLGVQQLWNSLQSFFIGGDIRKELPGPTKNFENCHKLWVKIMMDKAYPTKNVFALCASNELTPDLTDIDRILKECQQKLDIYLEGKRGQFPRFYFVSNGVLLDILSKRSDPSNIKSNLNIIFDAINDIEFNDVDKKSIIKIRQIKSEQTPEDVQEVDMSKHEVRCDGKIEEWLCDLVANMKLSLRDLFELAYYDIKNFYETPIDDNNRDAFKAFVQKYICQVVIFGLQLFGTKRLEEFIVRTSFEKGDSYKKKLIAGEIDPSMRDFQTILSVLTEMCRMDNKNKLDVVKLEALIIIHVHNLDIYKYFLTDKEIVRQVVTVNDYDWLKQTRVYWYAKKTSTKDIKTCLINITDVAFEYGYEFLGAKERMCITPLTDKCYITLAQAMGMQYGGAPAGPAGTGKTETVKDMGRTMGVFVLVTNCAPEHRYKNMAEIFKGLCRSGAWGCFDEFNRIQLEVLSVLATIISAIQDCRKKNQERFKFPEGANVYTDIELIPTMGYFITMNPGYSGRQELPENLKILFRGVTMMAPNRESIIRVKLCSYGFENHDDISKKFRKLYELCEAQLSKQQHYDFGLRNILSVLRHGGNEKKKYKEEPEKEEELIYMALRGMNLSKLVPDDKPLFLNLINDVFPLQKNAKAQTYPELMKLINTVLERKKLDNLDIWVEKIIQTYETYHVRHGFMIVGATGTGKTTIMEVLTEAMSEMDPTNKDAKWKIHRLNPKAVENEYLFIQKIEDTYILGVFTMIWKKCNEASSSYSKQNNWIVCDGPIDSIWIENLNTVLDDNKILTLSNNERISMIDSCRLVMECENVKNASLATVSRCGMIYITERDITYKPYIKSWFVRNKDLLKEIKAKYKVNEEDIKKSIDKLINEQVENELLKNFNPCMNISWLIKIKNFLLILESLLGDKTKTLDKAYVDKCIAFSFAWSIGSLYDIKEREKFHKYLTNKGFKLPEIQNGNTIFELSLEGDWEPWQTEASKIERRDLENFSSLLIPTMDSTRALFLVDKMTNCRVDSVSDRTPPCLLLGDSGTAKTSTILIYQKRFTDDSKKGLKRVNFSSATSPTNFQETVDDELEKSGNEYIPILDKSLVIFIDDLSMPYVNKWGDQVTLELVRQLLEFGGYYLIKVDENRGVMKKISKLSFVAAMNHPKGGKNDIPNRLKRHFFIFNMVLPNEQSVNDIYGKISKAFFTLSKKGSKKFSDVIVDQAIRLPKITSDLLKRMEAKFQPTPVKFHYSYNMRELSRTFQGIFNADRDGIIDAEKNYGIKSEVFLLCLWKHEVTRVFSDKLRDIEDKKEFQNIVDIVLGENFDKDVCDVVKNDVFFADYLRPIEVNEEKGFQYYVKRYENIVTLDKAREVTTNFMNELNEKKDRKHVEIVLFDDCLKNLMRITRVIQQDQGSCMIVGVGGSGKQSLTRLAAFCEQNLLIQPTYGTPPRPDDLRLVFRTIFNKIIEEYNPDKGKLFIPHTLLMTDAEFKIDYYLEVVSSFLATGEIANLFNQKNDKNTIIATMRTTLGKIPEYATKELDETAVWKLLIEFARKYLHVSLCFSPSSEKFREKFIKFPVLFNSCTIMWLLPWPEEALISVVKGAVESNDKLKLVGKAEQITQLYNHIAGVHTKISENVCKEYYDNFRRYVYVTPKSFLSFIGEYMKVYISKKEEISKKETTINTGLAKLAEAEKDIAKKSAEMQVQVVEVEKVKKEVDLKEQELSIKNQATAQLEKEVSAEEEKCNKNAEEIKKESEIVNRELALAKPKLDKAQQKIKDLDQKVLQPLGKTNVPTSIKFYFECCGIIMNKRLAIPDKFGEIDINKDTRARYYNPLGWTTMISYISASGYGSFFDTISEWQRKLEGNKLNINDETLELVKPFLEAKTKDGTGLFSDEAAMKIGGDACKRLAGFCSSISDFVYAVRDVIPKQQKVEIMSKKFAEAMAKLEVQQKKKAEVLEEKRRLEESLADVRLKKDNQQEILNRMAKKVNGAKQLIESLKGEKTRWSEDSKRFDQEKKQLLGDAAICAAFIAYAGPFNYTFRTTVLISSLFRGDVEKRGIPYTDELNIEEFLVDEPTKNEWLMSKLPSDTLSIQNAILVTTSSRYPLLIDPQDQAKNWLVNMYPSILAEKHVYQMATFCGKRFETYCNSLLGIECQIMIEGIENDVDTTLDPILERQFVGKKNSTAKLKKIMINGQQVDFDERFKMFLLCKLINPHFTPELAAKTTIIDFCVTAIGLEQQLQAIVISKEQRTLEETLKQILSDITKNKNSLLQCQKEILDNLNKEGNLLDNEDIVIVLNNSKTQAEDNTKKIKEAEEKKIDINQKREKYLPVATRGSVLYFSIVQMQEISKMYSTSLQQFLELFNYSIDNAIPSNNTEQRVKFIVKKLTEHVYKYIVRGLFEKHKTAFILLVCFKILTEEKIEGSYLLKPQDISFFIKCGGVINSINEPDCPYDFLGAKGEKKPKEYLNLLAISRYKYNETHTYFQRLPDKLSSEPEKFKTFYNAQDCENYVPYDDLYNHNKKLASFLKLIFVRAMREDRTIICATQHFIPTILDDKDFLNPYPEEIKDIYNITNATTPILFLLSAGADPSTNIENLAKKKNKHIDSISMGEGVLEIAVSIVETCRQTGDWVYFQNCHLGLDFMSKLDIMLKNTELEWNPEMRIWLSCEPRNEFPIGLLHQSLKVTNEPPKGIKAGMLKTYSSVVTAEKLDIFEYKEWKNLVFALSFIHSLVIERRKYGALGFCVPYDFNNSDLEASILFVEKQFSRESDLPDKKPPSEMINFKTLTNVVSNILYGGRIFDLKDESLFKTIVSSYLEDPAFKQPNYSFYPTPKDKVDPKNRTAEYKIPDNLKEITDYIAHISKFPTVDPPQVFGLHGSADMTFRLKEFSELLNTITAALPKDGAGGGGASKEDEVKPKVEAMLDAFPPFFNEKEYRDTINKYSFMNIGVGLEVPLNNVLLQEIKDIEVILELVKKSLKDIKDALAGTLLMTETITECIDSLYLIKPPNIWMFDANGSEISWLSPNASSWFEGLKIRAEKLREWLSCNNDQRPAFYLPGILKPQGFLAAFRQEFFKLKKKSPGNAKEFEKLALDQIDLVYTPDRTETDPTKLTKNLKGKDRMESILIYGLYIEGAIWGGGSKEGYLADDPDPNSRNTIIKFPVITVKGTIVNENKGVNTLGPSNASYSCPLYKYPKRTDKYLITDIKLKINGSDQDDKFWQRRGVALLCNKD
jgi:dynein heavy chain